MTYSIPITIAEQHNLNRDNQPVRIGVPLPRELVTSISQLSLQNESGSKLGFNPRVTSQWDDGSIRWVLLDFYATVYAGQSLDYALLVEESPQVSTGIKPASLNIEQTESSLTVDCGKAIFTINKEEIFPITCRHQGQSVDISWYLEDANHRLIDHLVVDNIDFTTGIHAIRSNIVIAGAFVSSNGEQLLYFTLDMAFFADSTICELDCCLHNPRPAEHPNGFWDLGDSGSVDFSAFGIDCRFSHSIDFRWKKGGNETWLSLPSNTFRLYQNSSGGEHWDHRIHIDKNREPTVSFKGYRLDTGDESLSIGDRVSPFFAVERDTAPLLQVHLMKFWQNFPSAFSGKEDRLQVELFPQQSGKVYELQGGERKTQTVWLDFGKDTSLLPQFVTPLHIVLSTSHYRKSQALPGIDECYSNEGIDNIILQGLVGKDNFFIKREKADEYGWRNFGDLWADHETLEHGHDPTRVSHYNNQYDPIYGLYRQFIFRQDPRWLELMDDLAKHVLDIDIYHTAEDRNEYNGGLFWHTDHYMDAGTCTHRTTSLQHMETGHAEQSGGGPSDEHCYTTGLMYHFFHTGNNESRKAVLSLADWIHRRVEGDGTVLDRINSFVKQDLKAIKNLLSGEPILNYKYGFHRGTGNFISTMLDAYLVSGDTQYLSKAEHIIYNTLSPQDDIELRDLKNIELYWSYTVLLQSLCKYLSIRKQTPDKNFSFVRDCLLHYAKWMLKNEKPYLATPELLVYPNDTWVAQDIRKAYIFYYAHQLTGEPQYLGACKYFTEYVSEMLSDEGVMKSTRILVILMQNHFSVESNLNFPRQLNQSFGELNHQTLVGPVHILAAFLSDIFNRMLRFSISKEYRWFKHRFINK